MLSLRAEGVRREGDAAPTEDQSIRGDRPPSIFCGGAAARAPRRGGRRTAGGPRRRRTCIRDATWLCRQRVVAHEALPGTSRARRVAAYAAPRPPPRRSEPGVGAGVHPRIAQELLRHASSKTTMEIDSHAARPSRARPSTCCSRPSRLRVSWESREPQFGWLRVGQIGQNWSN